MMQFVWQFYVLYVDSCQGTTFDQICVGRLEREVLKDVEGSGQVPGSQSGRAHSKAAVRISS